MAKTFVNAGRRRQYTPTLQQVAGTLTFKDGFFGVTQDDSAFSSAPTAVDRPQLQILDGVWDVPANRFDASIWNAGLKIYGQPTYGATSILLYANAASLPASPAAVPVGRLWATAPAGASLLRVGLFGPENQW